MIFVSWLLTFFVSLLQLACVILLAPWMIMLTRWIEGKIQGKNTLSFSTIGGEIFQYVYQPLLNFSGFTPFSKTFAYMMFLTINLVIALLIPDFTTGTILGKDSDFLLIISLLMTVPAFFFFLIYKNVSLSCFRKIQKQTFEILLFLPMFFLILLICRFSTFSTTLDQMVSFFHQGNSWIFIALSPLFISACSLFLVVMNIPDFSEIIEKDGFTKQERVMLLYGNDLQYLSWLSLIGFLLWPQSLAFLDLDKVSFLEWVLALFFGILAWLGKLILECCIVAFIRNFLFISSYMYKVGIATILNFLALMLYFAGLNGH